MKILNWSLIDTVLLDMDGTLLDLHFDNYFWLHYVPQCYADKNNLSFEQANNELMAKYKAIEGTMDWYCVDYWTDSLNLDIALLKEQVSHLIQLHPHVIEFLDKLKALGKQRILVTNAHQKSLSLKLRKTPLGNHLDQILTSHDFGLPKEELAFWPRLQKQLNFDPQRTLLIEDNATILEQAQNFGIKHLLAILKPDSTQDEKIIKHFPAVKGFAELF